MKLAVPAVLRGTFLGSLLGILPGGGAVLASFSSYTLEKKILHYFQKVSQEDMK
jgi:TctA family transporter